MANRALMVGINAYPGNALRGCLNDIQDMSNLLVSKFKWQQQDIRMLTDARATTAAIRDRLHWLVDGAKEGDHLVFHYSGHGAQYPDRTNGEADKLNEVIVPVEFDWTPEHMIQDKEFHTIFSKIPKGATLTWISDSCHSGDLSKDMHKPKKNMMGSMPKDVKIKTLMPPQDINWRLQTINNTKDSAKVTKKNFVHVANDINAALISGCRSDQTSADASFGGKPNGALTYFLLQQLNKESNVPLANLIDHVRSALSKAGYDQKPQLEGNAAIIAKPFLV